MLKVFAAIIHLVLQASRKITKYLESTHTSLLDKQIEKINKRSYKW